MSEMVPFPVTQIVDKNLQRLMRQRMPEIQEFRKENAQSENTPPVDEETQIAFMTQGLFKCVAEITSILGQKHLYPASLEMTYKDDAFQNLRHRIVIKFKKQSGEDFATTMFYDTETKNGTATVGEASFHDLKALIDVANPPDYPTDNI